MTKQSTGDINKKAELYHQEIEVGVDDLIK